MNKKMSLFWPLELQLPIKDCHGTMDVAYKFRCPNPNLIKVQVIIYLSKPLIKE
jgi:hypothetical protein